MGLSIFSISNKELINPLAKVVLPDPKSPFNNKISLDLIFIAIFFEKNNNSFKLHSNSNSLFNYLTLIKHF